MKFEPTHGGTGTVLHNRWRDMIKRCHGSSTGQNFARYKGRGITVCDEWRNSFVTFRDWSLANGFDKSLQIDRIDNDKGYSPDNCRWVTQKENSRNKERTIWLEIDGKSITMSELVEVTGIHRNTLQNRYYKGDRGETLIRPVKTVTIR
jgi:hypothetical protein